MALVWSLRRCTMGVPKLGLSAPAALLLRLRHSRREIQQENLEKLARE